MKRIFFLFFFIPILAFSAILDDIKLYWNDSPKAFLSYQQQKLFDEYPGYEKAIPGEQDAIRKKIQADLGKIQKTKISFTEKSTTYDNAIYAGLFHYENDETMITVIEKKKTCNYFFVSDKLWRVVFSFEKETVGKDVDINAFVDMITKKHGKPFKIDSDGTSRGKLLINKVYYKDDESILEVWYNDIYDSFMLVYTSVETSKIFKEKGLQVFIQKKTYENDLGVQDYNENDFEAEKNDDKNIKDDLNKEFDEIQKQKDEDAEIIKEKKKQNNENYKGPKNGEKLKEESNKMDKKMELY